MRDGLLEPFGGEGGKVQADETYIGRKHRKGPKARGFAHKMKVVSLLDERAGKTRLITDEARHYWAVGKLFQDHQSVMHGGNEYVRGDIATNHIECYFSIFKRGMRGVYQHCGEKRWEANVKKVVGKKPQPNKGEI